MDPNTKIKFSRNGIEIGEHKLWEVEVMIKTFKIFPTDHYWHEGMTKWEPVTKLLELLDNVKKDAQRKIAEMETKKAAELERSNYFKCNCCRLSFEKYEGVYDRFGKGVMFIFCSGTLYLFLFASLGHQDAGLGSVMCAFVALVLFIIGLGFMLSAFVRDPSCPGCGSSNFAKPEKSELSPK
jgi:hypothetical protein